MLVTEGHEMSKPTDIDYPSQTDVLMLHSMLSKQKGLVGTSSVGGGAALATDEVSILQS